MKQVINSIPTAELSTCAPTLANTMLGAGFVCLQCGIRKSRSKNSKCNTCRTRIYRKTQHGKDQVKKYNKSQKAKDCQKRFIEKSKQEKPQKIPKITVNCQCGSKVVAKGLCRRCYQKKNNTEVLKKKPFEKKPFGMRKFQTDGMFLRVLNSVKGGLTIDMACKKNGTSRSRLYQEMSPMQKKELLSAKYLVDIDECDDF